MTDYKALCAELVDAYYDTPLAARWVFGKARKLLNGEPAPDDADNIQRLTSDRSILHPLLRHGITRISEAKKLGPDGLRKLETLGTKRVAWIWDMILKHESAEIQ